MFRWVPGALGLTLLMTMAPMTSQAVTIQSQISPVTSGPNPVFRATYTVSGVDFRDNASVVDELAIAFPAAEFAQLSNGVAPASFDLLLFQPNDPNGADGLYSALALADHASVAGVFSVDFTLTIPANLFDPNTLMQTYFINEYDNNPMDGNFGELLHSESGMTVPVAAGATPEPSSLALCFTIAVAGGFCHSVRRRRAVSTTS